MFLSLITGSMKTPILLPWCPGIMNDRNTIAVEGRNLGEIEGDDDMGQHVYGAAIIPYGLNPSIVCATCTLRASSTLRGWRTLKYLHALASDGCTIFSGLYCVPFLCHVARLSEDTVGSDGVLTCHLDCRGLK
jgi:hypothetical protein